MALVLGPELDVFLRGIGEDLKGKTILEEPYVDKKTIVRAVSEQNKVILALQMQVLQMQELEKTMQLKMNMMQDKLTHLEKYTEKADVIEGILREKIPIVDKLDQKVTQHCTYLKNLAKEGKENAHDVAVFKDETRASFSEVQKGIESLCQEVELLPDNIVISSRQVTHLLSDEKEFQSNRQNNKQRNDILADIIAQQEQHTFVQDEHIEKIDQKVDDHVFSQCMCNNEMKKVINTLVDWKQTQSSLDLKSMKRIIENLQRDIEHHNTVLSKKMSKGDVERKLEQQFNEIVDHLQTALSTIENEEADFKCITDALSKICESLRESKADRSELTALRKQFITNQVGGSHSPIVGSTLDNEGIRRILSKYATKDEMLKLFDVCDGLDSSESPLVGTIYSKIANLRSTVLRLESMISTNNALNPIGNSVENVDFEERKNPEDSRPLMRKRPKSHNRDDPKNSRFGTIQEVSIEDVIDDDIIEGNLKISSIETSSRRNIDGLKFPSSNVLKGVLSRVHQDEPSCIKEMEYTDQTPFPLSAKKKSIRPSSAPLRKNEAPKPRLEKKHSLPAILTSANKTVGSRSERKPNLKNNIGRRIHKGSFQVISNPLDFDTSSDHILTSPSSGERDRPPSAEQRIKKKPAYLIRTSIE